MGLRALSAGNMCRAVHHRASTAKSKTPCRIKSQPAKYSIRLHGQMGAMILNCSRLGSRRERSASRRWFLTRSGSLRPGGACRAAFGVAARRCRWTAAALHKRSLGLTNVCSFRIPIQEIVSGWAMSLCPLVGGLPWPRSASLPDEAVLLANPGPRPYMRLLLSILYGIRLAES